MKFLIVLAFLTIGVKGEDEEKQLKFLDVFETCETPFLTKDYDPNWLVAQGVNENTTMYAPLISKGEMFRLTQQLYAANDFEDIKESHLVNSCFTHKKNHLNQLTMFGYNEKTFSKILIPVANAHYSYVFPKPLINSFGGQVFVSLSDRKTYELFVLCHDDGLGSFAVVSPQKTLSEGAMDTIKAHLKALGFQDESFLEIDYNRDCTEKIEDVPKPAKTVPLYFYSPPLGYPSNVLYRQK